MDDTPVSTSLRRRAFHRDCYMDAPEVRDRFSRALADMRERAGQLALEIGTDLPEYTRHDVPHTDALWELADLIAGPEVTLNPAEAFVFGASILTHDLAMSRASHRFTGAELRDRPEWPDALAAELRAFFGRAPHPSELISPPAEPALAAEKELLRSLHADIANEIPLSSWAALNSDRVYMITDPEIRVAYGRLIGSIAASHHWTYDQVVDKFASSIGAPAFAPVEWKVDALRLACLLRVADAAHLDSSRAPDLLAAVRNLPPVSRSHWVFQSRLQRPYVQGGRLVFTAPEGFARDEMASWWLAYDTLKLVDAEMKGADAVLLEKGNQPFRVRGLAHVDSPREFSSVVPCREWEPVEARIKVGDVARLVRRLGGAELYGSDPSVAIRELVTNACDAVKAREALSLYRGSRPLSGRVMIWIEEDQYGKWLVCSDNGIGMTPKVLGQQLLDFGCSSWLSPEVARDNIGLLASRFEPTGKFGLGFFSAFMLGNRVEVWSRPLSGSPADTWILEFSSGVEVRPTLRKAIQQEQLDEPGTVVRVLIDEELVAEREGVALFIPNGTLSQREFRRPMSLSALVMHLLPAPQVDIWASDAYPNVEPSLLMAKNDWLTLDGEDFLRRLFVAIDDPEIEDNRRWIPREIAEKYGPKLRIINDSNGVPVARACLIDDDSFRLSRYSVIHDISTVTAGPCRTRSSMRAVVGMFIGAPSRAARDYAVPLISAEEVAGWATEEAARVANIIDDPADWCEYIGDAVIALGGNPGPLPMWRAGGKLMNLEQLRSWIEARDSIVVVDPMYARVRIGSYDQEVGVASDVVLVESGYRPAMYGKDHHWPSGLGFKSCHSFFLDVLADVWPNSSADLLGVAIREEKALLVIGTHEGKDVRVSAARLRRTV
ncbi:Chaperone protein HtpG [Streptomyces sp. enrichment culture]|uniref:HD domain-containing protein n=1 Tax=Streptomyces sp. enrichment culture TaxID=1795815 RepID=UPI003F5799C7